ncbi:MAG TPA: sulfotransferase [Stellaceae bacterium]|nr:sulfotransferase [Stellaceae bacterium]
MALKPEFAEAHLNLGSALMALGRHQDAAASFAKALSLRPELVAARLNLGSALHALERYDEAAAQYRRVLAADPGSIEARLSLASTLKAADDHRGAVAELSDLLAAAPEHVEARINLGVTLEEIGRIEEARAQFEHAIAIAPGRALSYPPLIRLKRMTPGDPLLATMEALMRDGRSLTDKEALELDFALGKALADIGEHERSFAHLLAGNARKRRSIRYDEASDLERLARIAQAYTPELLQRLSDLGDPSPAPVFILGMPRSGSTLVEQILASHPKVFAGGERNDFRAAMREAAPDGAASPFLGSAAKLTGETLRRLGSAYLARLAAAEARSLRRRPEAVRALRITDKMPANFRFIGLIHLALPNARIIHTCRDPIDTCLSCFAQLFADDNQPFSYDLAELGRYYAAYRALMDHWRQVLPEGRILDVQYEDLVADVETHARRIVAYCGLGWADACLEFQHANRPVKTASSVQVRQPIYGSSVGRWRPDDRTLRPLLEALGIAATVRSQAVPPKSPSALRETAQ